MCSIWRSIDCFSFGLCSTDHVGSGLVVGGIAGSGLDVGGVRMTGTGVFEGMVPGGDGRGLLESTRFLLHVRQILLRRLSNSLESEAAVIMTSLETNFKETKKSHREWHIYLLSFTTKRALLSGIRSQSCTVLPS